MTDTESSNASADPRELERQLALLETQVRAHADRIADLELADRRRRQQALMLRLLLLAAALAAFFYLRASAGV